MMCSLLCVVCGYSIQKKRKAWDPIYCCNKCVFVAHIGCALNQTRTRYYYYTERKICSECKRELSWIPFCFCMECDVKLHIERVLPPSLKSKYHIHPLTLEIGFKEDDYCDICEHERDPMTLTDHVYTCTECGVPFGAQFGGGNCSFLKFGIGFMPLFLRLRN
ncbi:hypothetical protein GQ457_13G026440 [Hibiscus cannabinus]